MLKSFQNNKIGLVLGGGGVRGFFHIGVIKGLQELKIPISEIAGTSIGAVVGAMFAENPNLDIEKVSQIIDFKEIVNTMFWESRKRNTEELKKYLKKFIKIEKFEDLKIKLKFNATDINNRREVIFEKGNIFPGLIASISLPGILRPVNCDGNYLIDGGLIDNIPVSLIDKANVIIVSDITGPIKKINENSMGIEVLYSSIVVLQQKTSLIKMEHLTNRKIVYLNLKDDAISIVDFRKKNFQKLIDFGYEAIMEKKMELLGYH